MFLRWLSAGVPTPHSRIGDKGKIVLAEYENGIDWQQDAGGHRGRGDVPAEHEDDGEGGLT